MTALAVLASTFVAVFALGFQSQNVNQGHYWAAFLTSFAIGASSLVLYKALPDANLLQMSAYLIGGATGIVASMWAHRCTLGRKRHPASDWPADLDDEHPTLKVMREHHEEYARRHSNQPPSPPADKGGIHRKR